MKEVDLNSDLGESFGNYSLGMDKEVLKHVSSANIACGWHAGDPLIMDETIKLAKANNVSIGAHPGFLDLMGFGRRNISVSPKELRTYVLYQLGALNAFAKANHTKLNHVKAHGAMYNMAVKDKSLALGIAQAIYDFDKDLILLGLAKSQMIEAAKEVGLKYASEVFADRAYNDDGSLVARALPNSTIDDEKVAIQRVIKMVKENQVLSINGNIVNLEVDSICVHGDNPKAVEFAKDIRLALEKENIQIKAISE